jgi:hypothetical protein
LNLAEIDRIVSESLIQSNKNEIQKRLAQMNMEVDK